MEEFADYFEVTSNIRFKTRVTDIVWSEDEHMWRVTTDSGETMKANFLIYGTGNLNIPSLPNFKGTGRSFN